jgi:hypothetical protein
MMQIIPAKSFGSNPFWDDIQEFPILIAKPLNPIVEAVVQHHPHHHFISLLGRLNYC